MTALFDNLVPLVLAQLWQMTLLIPLAIWGVRAACRRRSHLAYGILLAVLLKCMVPPLWSSPAGVFSWLSHAVGQAAIESPAALVKDRPPVELTANTISAQAEVAPSETAVSRPVEISTPANAEPAASAIDWWQWGIISGITLWGGGIVAVVGYLIAKRIYLEQFHDDTRVESQSELLKIVRETADALELRRRPDLVVTTHPTIPFVVGWWAPRLVVSKQIVERSSPDEMQLIIAHELNHLRRWDTATNWCQLVVQAVWWFHPCVWWLNTEIRRWRESCCDEEVVARLKCPPARYAHTLLNVLDWQTSLRVTTGLDSLSPMEVTKQRLQNIMQPGQFPKSAPLTAWLMFGVVMLVVLPGAQFANLPQVAEAHDEIPDQPIIAESAGPSAPPVVEPIVTGPAPLKMPPVPVTPAKLWRYKPEVHRVYAYQVSIDEETLQGTTRHTGTLSVSASYISGGEWKLTVNNPQLMAFEEPSPSSPFRGMRPPRIPGPFDGGYSATISSRGALIEEQGDAPLPLFLGQWGQWLFRPLPETELAAWEISGETNILMTTERTDVPFGPLARTTATSRLAASYRDEMTRESGDQLLTLINHRTVQTTEKVDGEPTLELRDESNWQFDARHGMPTSLTGKGTITRRQVNRETKSPYKYSVQLNTEEEPRTALTSPNAPSLVE